MEPVGFAVGLLGLVGTVTACIDLWDIISAGRRVSEDLDSFLRQIQLESLKFFLWCELNGLWAEALKARAETTGTAQSRISHSWKPGDGPLSRTSCPAMIIQSAETNLGAVLRSLQKARELLEEYGACGQPRQRRRLQKKGALTAVIAASETLGSPMDREFKPGLWDGARWATSGHAKSERILSELKSSNEGLSDLIDLVDRLKASQFSTILEIGVTAPPLSRAMIESSASILASGKALTVENSTLLSLSQIAERERQTRELGVVDEGSFSWATPVAVPSVTETLHLNKDDFHISSNDGTTPERQFTSYRGQQVAIEWRYYSTRLSPEGRELLTHRINLLVLQLRESSSTPGFRIPPCLGFFHLDSDCRYGIVFQIPGDSKPQSLYECLVDDYEKHVRRDLEARLRIARQVVFSMFRFFSVGWLHKNVRSSSILFLDTTPDPLSLPKSYQLGFGFARLDSSTTAQTEFAPSVLQDTQKSREWRLYCHPDRDPALLQRTSAGTPLSHMRHDAYGLGIILIEIALWAPVTSICSKKQPVETFQADLVSTRMNDVRFHMGESYARVVQHLLEGDFDMDTSQGSSGESSRMAFLDAFRKTVVSQMESLLR